MISDSTGRGAACGHAGSAAGTCPQADDDQALPGLAPVAPLSEPDPVASLTIRGGRDKLGAPETVDLTLRPGEVVAIVGPTGAGKSRLLADIECLAQGDTPSGRRILINGTEPDPALRFAHIIAGAVLRQRGQRGMRAARLVGVAAAIQIMLRVGGGLFWRGLALGIDQHHFHGGRRHLRRLGKSKGD